MASTTAARPLKVGGDVRVVLPHVSWETYERLLADDEDRRVPQMTFDQGVLELVTPSMPHDVDSETIALVVDIVAANLGVPIWGVGSTTFR